jgi:hypothetical protein
MLFILGSGLKHSLSGSIEIDFLEEWADVFDMVLWTRLDRLDCADDGIRLWSWEIRTEIWILDQCVSLVVQYRVVCFDCRWASLLLPPFHWR